MTNQNMDPNVRYVDDECVICGSTDKVFNCGGFYSLVTYPVCGIHREMGVTCRVCGEDRLISPIEGMCLKCYGEYEQEWIEYRVRLNARP